MGLLNVTLLLTDSPPTVSYVPGVPKCFRLGFYQFQYGLYVGKLQPINWLQCQCFPERPGATGMYIFVPDDIAWNAATYLEPTDGMSVETEDGIVNLIENEIAGISDGNISDVPTIGTTPDQAPAQIPVKNNTALVKVASGKSLTLSRTDGTALGAQPWLLALAMATDIAQKVCMWDASETTQTFPNPARSSLLVPTAGAPKWAQIDVFSVTSDPNLEWGSRGIPILGKCAWDYDGYKTPAEDINGLMMVTAPPAPGATGFYILLKPGVKVNVTLGVNTYDMSSIISDLGEINLLANKLAGLGSL